MAGDSRDGSSRIPWVVPRWNWISIATQGKGRLRSEKNHPHPRPFSFNKGEGRVKLFVAALTKFVISRFLGKTYVGFRRTKFRTLPEEPRLIGLIAVVPLVILTKFSDLRLSPPLPEICRLASVHLRSMLRMDGMRHVSLDLLVKEK
jgi:hypothetical protein